MTFSAGQEVSETRPIASRLMRYRDQNGQGWADIIDFLTMYPDALRRVVQVLGELEAAGTAGGTHEIDHVRHSGSASDT